MKRHGEGVPDMAITRFAHQQTVGTVLEKERIPGLPGRSLCNAWGSCVCHPFPPRHALHPDSAALASPDRFDFSGTAPSPTENKTERFVTGLELIFRNAR
jgi:hypothetical protein